MIVYQREFGRYHRQLLVVELDEGSGEYRIYEEWLSPAQDGLSAGREPFARVERSRMAELVRADRVASVLPLNVHGMDVDMAAVHVEVASATQEADQRVPQRA